MYLNKLKILLFFALIIPVLPVTAINMEKLDKAICKLMPKKYLNKEFLLAVKQDNLEKVKYYIDCGANINATNIYSAKEWEERGLGSEIFPFYTGAFSKYSALMLAKSYQMVKYLLSKGANVNYVAHFNQYGQAHSLSVIQNMINYPSKNMIVAVFRAGAIPTQEDIDFLQQISRQNNPLAGDQVGNNARFILNFIAWLARVENKKERMRLIDQAIQGPVDITKLIGKYVVGEDEEKRNQEPELVVHFPEEGV